MVKFCWKPIFKFFVKVNSSVISVILCGVNFNETGIVEHPQLWSR